MVLLLVAVSAAWACTGQPRVFTVSQPAAAEGQAVEARGEATQANRPIAIRWNNLEGEVLGAGVTDATGAFAVPITLPKAAPGIYSVVLTGDTAAGRTTIEITAPGDADGVRATAPDAPWSRPGPELAQPGQFGREATVGALFLSIGMVGLFVAFAVAASGRRRRVGAAVSTASPSQRA